MTANGDVLVARGLRKEYAVRRGVLQRTTGVVAAVNGVDLRVGEGECLALVGESGSGKTTLARMLLRLVEPTAGAIELLGEDFLALSGTALRRRRRWIQMVFQDPYGSLNPRMRVGRIVAEPIEVHALATGAAVAARVGELLDLVGLPASSARRYPGELSGGQRQRVGIARALATEPRIVVADEPVSALDVSVQAQIVNLLVRLQRELGLSLLFIAHDLAVVEQIADRVAVIYLGRIVEEGARREVFQRPRHPYTQALLEAVPVPDPAARRARPEVVGEPPSPLSPPSGCPYHPRCPRATARCAETRPELEAVEGGHEVACYHPADT